VPVFAYEFNDPEAPPVGNKPVIPPNDVFGFPTASEHASELQFLFNFNTPLNATEQELADQMKTYWANFVKTGDPNIGREVNLWSPFQVFGAVPDLVTDPASPAPVLRFPERAFLRHLAAGSRRRAAAVGHTQRNFLDAPLRVGRLFFATRRSLPLAHAKSP